MITEKEIMTATEKITTTSADYDSTPLQLDSLESIKESTANIDYSSIQPRNRAERRKLEKATRRQKQKKRAVYIDNIKEAAETLAYINMIQKVRELNEKIKEEGENENEGTN